MRKAIKKVVAAGLAMSMLVLATGCGSSAEETTAAATEAAAEEAADTEAAAEGEATEAAEDGALPGEGVTVALISDVAGTQVFVLDMIAGLEAAAEKYGFDVVIAECPDAAAYEDNARAVLEEGADLIIGGSWQAGDAINKLATEFPDRADYALVDSTVEAENVKCIAFREQEGAYLIGKIAGMVTDDDAELFGAIHVSQGPSSFKWRWGYMEGVKSEKPDAKFVFNYVGDYNDPAKAKEYAIQQFEQGCQFINSAAAGGDKGTFEAALENGFYTSGQDVDLTDPENPYIVTSQIKDTYATMVYLMDQYFGDWNTENETLGIAEGAIGAVYVTHESENPRTDRLTDEDIALLKETADKIASKEIDLSVVPAEETYEY